MTGTRRYSWFAFPYCRRCKWHITWSGRFKTGLVGSVGVFIGLGGAAGGGFLERANEELERASLEKRSFIPHMVRSVEEEKL